MEQSFSSAALEANLYATRNDSGEIPGEQQQFLNYSAEFWGVNNFTREFLFEFNHPFPNFKLLSDQIKRIALENLWIYSKCEDTKFAIDMIIRFITELFDRSQDLLAKESLLSTYIQFLEKLVSEIPEWRDYWLVAIDFMDKRAADQANRVMFVESSGLFKTGFNCPTADTELCRALFGLTKKMMLMNAEFWEETINIEHWYQKKKHLFTKDYSTQIDEIGKAVFAKYRAQISDIDNRAELIEQIPSFKEIANYYRRFANNFDSSSEKIYYLFFLLNLPGMNFLKDHLLWDINKLFKSVLTEISGEPMIEFIEQTFEIFNELISRHQSTVLDCILTFGKAIAASGDQHLISTIEQKIIDLGFISPGELYLNEDWQMHRNINHIKNIRTWLELIESAPTGFVKLLPALIVNLRLGGIFISDTDLFQKDVSKLLNSDIEPIYKQVKQLCRIFPIYFNEIGAEGELREITTFMDEICHRKDRLIHFLRKQVHTESNNTHIALTMKILRFWFDADLEKLKNDIPADVYASIDLESEYFVGMHHLMKGLCAKLKCEPEQIIERKEKYVLEALDKIAGDYDTDRKRITRVLRLLVLLKEKYSLSSKNIFPTMKRYSFFDQEEINKLSNLIDSNKYNDALAVAFSFMDRLNQVVFNTEKTESWENIYYKRHVAVGIPSMYGEYHERKFEALGLIFRLERLTAHLIEKQIAGIKFNYLNANSLRKIYRILENFRTGIELDGIRNQVFNSNLKMFKFSLSSNSFSLGQYINIFQFIHQNIKEIINKYFFRVYDSLLKKIIVKVYPVIQNSSEKERSQFMHKMSEEFYREALTSAYLLQSLDSFIANTISTLRLMNENYPEEVISGIMSYDPEFSISPMDQERVALDNQVFLGSKAYFLKKLYGWKFPVPPGFVITTEVFRLRSTINQVPMIRDEFDAMILSRISELESQTGHEFGNPENPLLLSVRSGTAISMPGAMSTFLNVGLNDEIVEGLSRQPNFGWTSWDCYRRFLQSWGMAYGIDRDEFDRIMIRYKTKYKVSVKQNFTPEQMKEIAFSYKDMLHKHDIHFMDDPFLQLKQAIKCVFDSWYSDRAQVFREHLNISKEWGTAVVIQEMVLGNIHYDSGTGVVFTHDPDDTKQGLNLYGDFTLCSQGEDVVGGLVHVLPVSESQRKRSFPDTTISLEESFPEIYNQLKHYATMMTEEYGFNHQEIEFTFESSNAEDLYILQTRDQIIQKPEKLVVFAESPNNMEVVGRGIGTGGSAMNGLVAFDLDDIELLKNKYPEEKCILVRPDTVPDDIGMIFECDGLITGKGGATSHAAVTAVRLGKTCIVNCLDLSINERNKTCLIGSHVFKVGDKIALDGHVGNIYKGNYTLLSSDIEA